MGHSPIETQTTFEMQQQFDTMAECKQHLLTKDPVRDTFDVMWELINDTNFDYDWLLAGCKNDITGEEFVVEPTYPKGKPDELKGLQLLPGLST